MEILQFISNEMIVLIPTLYILGLFLKVSEIKDKFIPITLLILGVIGALIIERSFAAIINGILCAGAAVFTNQLLKQFKKAE